MLIGDPTPIAAGIDKAIIAAAQQDPRMLAIMEDMRFPGLSWWIEHAPERVVEVGIAEQNGAGVAAGLAAEGFIPVIFSLLFAAFGRAYNQIRQSILVDRFNVKIIGAETAWGEWGVSHNTIEGIGMARVLPNLVVLNPADVVEAEKAITAMLQYVGPVLLRWERMNAPAPLRIFTDDYPFELGKAHVVRVGRDATIIATGYMLTEAIRAAELLDREGIDVAIVNMCTLKPLDDEAIIDAAERTGAIVTAENGTVVGGLGDGVAAVLAEQRSTPLIRVGIEDEFSQSGLCTPDVDELKGHFGLGAEDLAVSVRECISRRDHPHVARRR